MKKLGLLIFTCVFISGLTAQETESGKEEKPQKRQKGKRLLFELFTDTWQSKQAGITFNSLNRGGNIYYMREKSNGNGKFGIAMGVGVGSHNLYSDGLLKNEISTGKVVFEKIPDTIDYVVNKFTMSYIDIPIEIRFHPKGKFKMAAGFRTGFLLSSHSKYSGKDLDGSGVETKVKYYKIKNLETLRYGITGRVGYKYFNLSVFYSLSEVFKQDKGPKLYPISFGLIFTPF